MTQNRSRQTPAGATESPVEEPAVMDPAPTPAMTGPAITPRVAYAVDQLVTEFRSLFPETPVEYSNRNRFGVALDVRFDLSNLDNDDILTAVRLLGLVAGDERVQQVLAGGGDMSDQVLISFNGHPVTQDDRASFGLAEGRAVLDGAAL